jgi:acyl-CoA thioesterase-1
MTPLARHIALFVLIVFCAATPAPAQDVPVAAPEKTLLAFGDSLMAGYGLRPQEAFPAQLEKRLRADGLRVRVVNGGVNGETMAGGLGRLETTLAQVRPQYVLLALGGNDLLRRVDPGETKKNLEKMLTILQKHHVPVLVAGMRSPRSIVPAYFDGYNRIYRAAAGDYGALYYPFLLDGVALNASYTLEDGLHPNAAGVGVMVDNIIDDVKDLLGEKGAVWP